MLSSEVINPTLESLNPDFLYHLGLHTEMDLKSLFGDVEYVCMGGSPDRAKVFADKAANKLGIPIPKGGAQPIGKTERCGLYKVGPILSISHGMGMPSMSIFLHELTKLLHYAGCKDVPYIRIGTSGGVLGEEDEKGGTVVVSTEGLSDKLTSEREKVILGEVHTFPTTLDAELRAELLAVREKLEGIKVIEGKTLGTDDFYEGQARSDGAVKPPYTPDEALAFIKKLYDLGVRNIEMESTEFAAWCNRAEIRGAIVCATLLNRFKGDQVTATLEELGEFSDNAQKLVIEWLRSKMTLLEKAE